MKNLEAIQARFITAKSDFKKVKDKHMTKLTEGMSKNKLEPVIVKSFDEFIKEQ